MLLAASLLLYVWCVLFVAGNATLAFLSKKIVNAPIQVHSSVAIILGICSITSIVSILHLWLPIAAFVHLVVLLLLAIYVFLQREFVSSAFVAWCNEVKQFPLLYSLLFLVAVVSITARTGSGDIADYHLQGIKWAEHYQNILGLGNFNKPLANNYWWFNIQAFFGLDFIGIQSLYVMNAVLFTTVTSYFIHQLFSSEFRIFYAVLLCFLILNIKTAFIGAVTPDVCVNYIIFILFSFALDTKKSIASIAIYLWIFAFIITVKITSAMLIVLVCVFLFQRKEFIIKYPKPWITFSLILSALFFIPWLAGNVVNSGYVFPLLNQIDLFDVDWKVPSHFIEQEREIITQWSKIPNEQIEITKQLSVLQWVPRWFGQYDLFNRGLILASALGFYVFVSIIVMLLIKKTLLPNSPFLMIVVAAYAGLFLLFFTSPQLRFMFGFVVVCIALVAQLILSGIHLPMRFIQIGISTLILALLGMRIIYLHNQYGLKQVVLTPPSYPKNKKLNIEKWGAETIYTTQLNNACWDQFPCTYYLLEGTTMRGNIVEGGFKNNSKK